MSDWRSNPKPTSVTRAVPVEPTVHPVCMGCARRHVGAIAVCPHCEKRPGAHGSRFCDVCCGAFICARCGNDHGLCYECHSEVFAKTRADALSKLRESKAWKDVSFHVSHNYVGSEDCWKELRKLVEGGGSNGE